MIVGEAAWDDESPIVRVGIASLAAACLRTRLQQSQQLTAGAGTGMSKQQESPGQADDILDLQNMTMHAVAKLRQQLLHETTPDALTSLMKLVQTVAGSIVYMLSRCKQIASRQPKSAHAKRVSAHSTGRALVVQMSDVASCAEQFFLAAEGANTLDQHSTLLGQLAQSIYHVAAAAHSSAAVQLPRSFSATAAAVIQKLLARILAVLSRPPMDTFSNIGGAPAVAGEDMQGAAERWQHDSAVLLGVVRELLNTLATYGSLQLSQKQRRDTSMEAGAEAAEQSGSAGSFWNDVKLASGSSTPSDKSQTHAFNGRPHGVEAISEQMSRTTINKNAQQPDSRPALKQPLIVELEEDPSPKMSAASQNQVPSREDGSILSRGGVIIEEEPDEVSGSADDVSEAEIPALTASAAADVLLVSALHSTDGQLDAPWASAGTSSAAASVLECLAGHIGATRSSKKATRGNPRSAASIQIGHLL